MELQTFFGFVVDLVQLLRSILCSVYQCHAVQLSGVVSTVTTPNTEEQRRTRETNRDNDRIIT